jgi:hypothetical protein
MKRQNQFIANACLFAQFTSLISLVVGGGLNAIAATVSQTAQTQSVHSNILIAQTVVDTLPPPPPPVTLAKERRQSPPQASPSQPFTPREIEFKVPVATPASNNLNYLVYVDDSSLLTLQQVQQVEPKAFVRQYNGHSVIQAGVFSKDSNAQQLAKKLQSKNIDVRLVSLGSGEETDLDKSKAYFVVIPANDADLALVENQVRQLRIDIPVNISQKEQPRGSHVKVGPLSERSQAERLNRYMLDSGLKNARVYFGR